MTVYAADQMPDLSIVSTSFKNRVRTAKKAPHVLQAIAAVRANRIVNDSEIIGTENMQACELYGWVSPIEDHADRTGTCFIMPLVVKGQQWIVVNRGDRETIVDKTGEIPRISQRGKEVRLPLQEGVIYRLNDHAKHGIDGEGWTVAIFMGCFHFTESSLGHAASIAAALKKLQRHQYDAPRLAVSYGLMPDECYVDYRMMGTDLRVTPIAKAIELLKTPEFESSMVITCSGENCRNVASILDRQYPYFLGGCLCTVCNAPNPFIGQTE